MHELVLSFLPTYTIFIIFFLPLDTQFPSVFELEITSQFEKIHSSLSQPQGNLSLSPSMNVEEDQVSVCRGVSLVGGQNVLFVPGFPQNSGGVSTVGGARDLSGKYSIFVQDHQPKQNKRILL